MVYLNARTDGDEYATIFAQEASGAYTVSSRYYAHSLAICLAAVFSLALAAIGGCLACTLTRGRVSHSIGPAPRQ